MADTITQLYARLRPLIQRDMRSGVTVVNHYTTGDGGGGGGTGISDHGSLLGLSDDDHLQYFNTTRGDARYIRNTRNLIAGAGLTGGGDLSADRTFNIATPANSGITVNADDIALHLNTTGGLEVSTGARVKLPTNSGLSRDATGLRLAPSTLTHATANALAADLHTHQVDASSDVGTVPAAALLKSAAGGALTLGSLSINNGDLRVFGTGVFYGGADVLWVDASQGNVGIMGVPDPQFALDVWGPLRAQYFIGPHAIQLKNVLLLAHFDGRLPFETNHYGEPNGHMGQVASVSGGVLFREGMFGTKAVELAEASTNLCINPSFEVDTTGWIHYAGGDGTGTFGRTSSNEYVGQFSAILSSTVDPGSSNGIYTADISLPNGSTLHVQCRCYKNTAGVGHIEIYDNTTGVVRATVPVTKSNEWERVSASWTNTTGSTKNVRFRIWNTAPTTQNLLVDACQAEIGTAMTPYFDGSLAGVLGNTGLAWSGTAHASQSTRVASNLNYATASNIDITRGTVMAWVYRASATGLDTILRLDGTTSGLLILRCNAGGAQAFWGTESIFGGSVPADTWTHVAMTFSGSTFRLYVNGIEVASSTGGGISGVPARMYVGRSATGANVLNGKIDDLVILSSVLDQKGILAVVESEAPVFAETSRFSFRATPRNLVWADDDGLWMRNVQGNAVLGAYGGSDVDYPWGGLLLNTGDVMIGTSASYMMWDDSLNTLKVKGQIEVIGTIPSGDISGLGDLATLDNVAYGTGTVSGFGTLAAVNNSLGNIIDGGGYAKVSSTIIAGGFIRVGSGTKDSTLDGFHIDSTEIVGQLNGIDQVTMGTDGKFRAGTRHVFDADGISVTTAYNEGSEYGVQFYSGGERNASVYYISSGAAGVDYSDLYLSAGGIQGTHEHSRAILRAQRFGTGMRASVILRAVNNAEASNASKGAYLILEEENGQTGRVTTRVNGIDRAVIDSTGVALTGNTTISSGGLDVNSGSLSHIGGVLSLGGFGDNVGRIKPAGFHTVLDNGTLGLGTGFGFLFVTNSTNGHGALYFLRGTAAVELLDTNGTFSITAGTASSNNIYWDGSQWRIENKRGANVSYHVIWLGLSNSF
jgi:hypothetical protein